MSKNEVEKMELHFDHVVGGWVHLDSRATLWVGFDGKEFTIIMSEDGQKILIDPKQKLAYSPDRWVLKWAKTQVKDAWNRQQPETGERFEAITENRETLNK